MTKRALVAAPTGRLQSRHNSIPVKAMEGFDKRIRASTVEGNVISVFGVIGEDWMVSDGQLVQTGTTAQQFDAHLKAIGDGPVTVRLDSPGGDMFDGLSIYNMLRDHPGEVTVEVVGRAASAASIIAMAGDKVRMGPASFLMIHNTWLVFSGNRNDFTDMSESLMVFDKAMAGIYSARTGTDEASIIKMMDAETWISAGEAVEQGFADEISGEAKSPTAPQATVKLKPQAAEKQLVDDAVSALEAAVASLNLYI